jgi:hypothetical protein
MPATQACTGCPGRFAGWRILGKLQEIASYLFQSHHITFFTAQS